jgi:hypothetical protein
MGLSLADAVHHRVVHIPLEPDSGELPGHPQVLSDAVAEDVEPG